MDDETELTPFEELGPIRRSTQSELQSGQFRNVRPEVLEAIGEMFARFPPASQADLETRALRIRLMAEDLLDVDPDYIRRAARELARETPYLPKAFDVMEKVKGYRIDERYARDREQMFGKPTLTKPRRPETRQAELTREAARAILLEEGIGPGHFLWTFAGGQG